VQYASGYRRKRRKVGRRTEGDGGEEQDVSDVRKMRKGGTI
jgi:hypothetical protein